MADWNNFRLWALLIEQGLGPVAPQIAAKTSQPETSLSELLIQAQGHGYFRSEWSRFQKNVPKKADPDLVKAAWLTVRITGATPTTSQVYYLYDNTYKARKLT